MKLRNKVILALILAAIVPLSAISYYTINTVEAAFVSKEVDTLNSVMHEKSTAISAYFNKINQQLEQMSRDEKTIDAVSAFAAGFSGMDSTDMFTPRNVVAKANSDRRESVEQYYDQQFISNLSADIKSTIEMDDLIPKSDAGMRLQNLYISDNPHPVGSKNNLHHAQDKSQYSNYHAKFHPYFNRFLQLTGYYDVFLVEPENGYIVYSVFKEIDYATSLISGPYADSGIGMAFRSAMSSDEDVNHTIDYSYYLPSYNAPVLFFSRRIVQNGELKGVLILQAPLDRINSTVSSVVGLGETGKAYIYSNTDGLLRSQLAFVEENTVLGENSSIEHIDQNNENNQYFNYVDYLGNNVIAVSEPIEGFDLNWSVVTEHDISEAFKESASIKRLFSYAFALCLLACVVVALWLLRNIRRQLGAEPDFLNEIATEIANGNLTRDFSDYESSSGTLRSMVLMQKTLKERDESDKETLTRMSQLRDGLQKITTPVALASRDHKITFINSAMEQLFKDASTSLKTIIPAFDYRSILDSSLTVFTDGSYNLSTVLESLSGVYECEFTAGDRIFSLVFNGMYSDTGERIGTSMEWKDVTDDRRVMDEVDDVVSDANKGILTSRVNEEDKQGVYLELSRGINGLLDINQKFVGDVSGFLGAISAGDLTKSIEHEYQGAFADVKQNANVTVEKLMEVVVNIRSVAGNVNSTAGDINSGNIDLSQRTEQATESLEQTSAKMVEMTESVLRNAEHSKEAKALALNAMTFAQKGGNVVGEAVAAMEEINESSGMISDIIGVIDDIAFQTNLLALNASVEAARAGEQGRGFAVVASEVRNLAGRSAKAAKEIKELIEDSVVRVGKGAEFVNESGKTLDHIVTEVNKVAGVVSEISESSQEQSDGIGSVNRAIEQLDQMTQQNAALVEEASAASQSASEQAASLIRMIEFFSAKGSSNSVVKKTKLKLVSALP